MSELVWLVLWLLAERRPVSPEVGAHPLLNDLEASETTASAQD